MGFNTAAIILNDMLREIEHDPKIGERIYHGVSSAHRDGGRVAAHSEHGIGIGAIQVLPSQHADYVQIVAIGGNCIRRLGSSGKWEPEDLLRDLADQLGYSLRKRPAKTAA
jgi:predicted flavoprotein YhiN